MTPTQNASILFGTVESEFIAGTAGADTIDALPGNDLVYGYDGNDSLFGGTGMDTLYGGLGDDVLAGGAGKDKLYGDDGDDQLQGGKAADLLKGGYGSDTFIFDFADLDGADTIDFNAIAGSPPDLIRLIDFGFTGLIEGENFFFNAFPTVEVPALFYYKNVLYFDWDGPADASSIPIAIFIVAPIDLNVTDFILG
ncbi:MAG TPA: hypothetical protein VIT92_00305 [Burkholderiaceae bacterium]